jgi:copper resistance protein B
VKRFLCLVALATNAQAQHEHHHEASEPASAPLDEDDQGLRDPHAYSGGYTYHLHPYLDPQVPGHAHGGDNPYLAITMERFEVAVNDGKKPSGQYESELWYGTSFEKLLLRTEGEALAQKQPKNESELLWAHAIHPYWDAVIGAHYETAAGKGHGEFALGLRGIAPYWFETEANLYLSVDGHATLNAEVEYEILVTQRLILEPRLEVDFADGSDTKNLQQEEKRRSMTFGMRLRYEIYRRFAPYIGLETAQSIGHDDHDSQESPARNSAVAGVKFWL